MAGFLKDIGGFLGTTIGGVLGAIPGIVEGAQEAYTKIKDGGSLEDAGNAFAEKFTENVESAANEGNELGEKHFPTIAEAAGKVALVIGAAAAASKISQEVDKKLGGNNNLDKKLYLFGEEPTDYVQKIGSRFTKSVVNRK